MKIRMITVAHREEKEAGALFKNFADRIGHYVSFEQVSLKASKHPSVHDQLKEEAEAIQKKINPEDQVILLDYQGKQFTSVDFAGWLQKKLNASRNLVFVI